MARQAPSPRLRLDTDTSTPVSQRSQTRIRRSACSDLQNSTIPEEKIFHDHRRRRASLFAGRTTPAKNSTEKQPTSEGDYMKFCRQRCQSLYKSLANKTTSKSNADEEEEEEQEETPFPPPSSSRRNYRYSLPDASPAALALRNILKRNKTTKHQHVRLDLPSHSSAHSFSASSSSSSPIATFRHFLSLVKNKSSTSIHHSSLTTLSNATGGSATTLDQTTILSIPPAMQWHLETEKSAQWCSADGTSRLTLGSIELHNFTSVEHKQLKRIVLQRLQTSQYDLGMSIHVPKDEPVRKRKSHFTFRSKSSEKSKEAKDGNVFGVALSQCVTDDDNNNNNNNNSSETNERRTSPSGSISSTNDSGCSISPASPSSLYVFDPDYEETKLRSVSLEALGSSETATGGINRIKTLRCYPAKVPELIKNCCDYLEKNALQTVGLFRVGVSKKRLKELKEQVNLNRNVTFDSSTNAHDIAGLIKEFLRELPEPLLTRDLCSLFVHVRTKLNPKDQSRALSYLICLLPSINRDTLYTLLKFLNHVSINSQDRLATDGKVLAAGNKMDAANLAIVFAPTILMDGKTPIMSGRENSVAMTADQMEQGKSVLKILIEQYKDLFMVDKDLHNEVCVALREVDPSQLVRALAFKVQRGCGIHSMQLEEAHEQFLTSVDVSSILCDLSHHSSTFFSTLIPRMSTQPASTSNLRRYNLRRNSDFPCSSTHASRSSEFLQVPSSSSQQRLTQPTLSRLLRTRDIREATIDQIQFRVLDSPTEPIINISSVEDPPPIARPTKLQIKDPEKSTAPPLLREIKSYSRSRTAPLSSLTGAQQYATPKRCEARDLCGSSSTEESTSSKKTSQQSTLV